MADPVSIVKSIIGIGLQIKNTVDTFHHNQEGCRMISQLMYSVNAVVRGLQPMPNINAMSIAMEGLKTAMERSCKFVTDYKSNNTLFRVASANNTAQMLNRVYQDITLSLILVNLAIRGSAFHFHSFPQLKIEHLGSLGCNLLIAVTPLKLCFNFEPNKEAVCPVTLNNFREHYYISVWILTNKQFKCKRKTIVDPGRTLAVPVVMKKCEQPPQVMARFEVLMVVASRKDFLEGLEPPIINGKLDMNSQFVVRVKQMGAEMYWETLTATCERPSFQIIRRSIVTGSCVTSTDVHPSMPWIMTGHEGGFVTIRDYEKIIMHLQLDPRYAVRSAKFIPQWNRLAVGDSKGFIHICRYMDINKLYVEEKFRASRSGHSVDILTVHPTSNNYLLSWSASDGKIILWDLNFGEHRVTVRTSKVIISNQRVRHLKFNPCDTSTFACVTDDNRAVVWKWNIESSSPINTLEAFNADIMGGWMGTLSTRGAANNSKIWNLLRNEVAHTFGVRGHRMTCFAWHPTVPILATTLDDGTVCLWNTTNYRLKKMVRITRTNNSPCDLAFVMGPNGLTRLVVTYESEIAFMELKIKSERTGGQSRKISFLFSCTY